MADEIEDLSVALDRVSDLIAGIAPTQWDDPTPCADWSVRDLVQHVTRGNLAFSDAIRGEPAAPAPTGDLPDGEANAHFRHSASALLDAFREPGVLEKVVTVPFGSVPGAVALHLRITEMLVHGWDLARATGQAASFPAELAETELAFSRPLLDRIPGDRRPFAEPQDAPPGAPPLDRLAALLGRKVTV